MGLNNAKVESQPEPNETPSVEIETVPEKWDVKNVLWSVGTHFIRLYSYGALLTLIFSTVVVAISFIPYTKTDLTNINDYFDPVSYVMIFSYTTHVATNIFLALALYIIFPEFGLQKILILTVVMCSLIGTLYY